MSGEQNIKTSTIAQSFEKKESRSTLFKYHFKILFYNTLTTLTH